MFEVRKFSFNTVLICGALILTLLMGLRQSMGLFLAPMTMELQVGREVYAFGLAVSNLLWGFAGPFAGMLADKYGTGRMALIGRCAEALASRLASHCPQCHAPGWHAARPLAGAACTDCGAPTRQPRAWQWACPCCGHHHEQPCTEPASPAQCDLCNP